MFRCPLQVMSFLTLVVDDINAVNAINAVYVFFGMEDEFNGCEKHNV